jgi:hypothetical protein
MKFQIVYPLFAQISGDNYNEAIKNYIKFTDKLKLNSLIIKDSYANKHLEAKIRYYTELGMNKIGITTFPISEKYINSLIIPNSIGILPIRYPYI